MSFAYIGGILGLVGEGAAAGGTAAAAGGTGAAVAGSASAAAPVAAGAVGGGTEAAVTGGGIAAGSSVATPTAAGGGGGGGGLISKVLGGMGGMGGGKGKSAPAPASAPSLTPPPPPPAATPLPTPNYNAGSDPNVMLPQNVPTTPEGVQSAGVNPADVGSTANGVTLSGIGGMIAQALKGGTGKAISSGIAGAERPVDTPAEGFQPINVAPLPAPGAPIQFGNLNAGPAQTALAQAIAARNPIALRLLGLS